MAAKTADAPAKGARAAIPLPTLTAVKLADVPPDARSAAELTDAERTYGLAIIAALTDADMGSAKGGPFEDRATAENSSRRVRRLVTRVGNLPDGKVVRSVVGADGSGWSWWFKLGTPSAAGRKPAVATDVVTEG